MRRVIGVAGFKNSGKTTLVEKLVRHLTGQGYRVSTVKHAHHSFDIDHEGRDSFRHRKAGASEVAVISRERTALIHELRGDEPPSLAQILEKLQDCDLVVVEGYKRDGHDKIEVRNLSLNHPELAGDDPTVIAIAADGAIANAPVPVFDRDDVSALAAFIIRVCKLTSMEPKLRRAGPADADAVRALTRAVYAKWVAVIGREPRPMSADYDKAVRDHWIDLFEQDGTLQALIEMIPKADHLVVENLAVAEGAQGQGLGQVLMAHALRLAKSSGLPEIRLYTNQAFAENLRFYQNRGFEIFRREPLADGGTIVHFRKSVS
jgi:molybdopterin-guanine dinucleotide biosynthesis adapter protein